MWMYWFAVVAVVCMTCKETYSLELEEFLASLSSKKDENSSEEIQEVSQVNQEELLQFVKRSGLMAQPQQAYPKDSDSLDNQKLLQMLQTLQSMNKQQNLMAYSPEYAQASPLPTSSPRSPRAIDSTQPTTLDSNSNMPYPYQKPSSNSLPSSSLSQDQQNNLQYVPQQRSQYRHSPQYIDAPTLAAIQKHSSQASNAKESSVGANANIAHSSQRESISNTGKSTVKDDRQGHYPYEAYSGHDSGYGHARNPVYAHEPQYAHHEPAKHLSLPIPQVAIKFDPLGLLKLLLSGLPRPLFNLNGKIFLGLELGKGAGLAVGGPVGHHGGSKNLITIG